MSSVAAHDGTKLFVRDWGSGPPLLFVASASVPSDIWTHAMPRFVDAGYRCIAFDRRGHGRSDEPSTGYDIDTLACDVQAVADALRLERFAIVGHSLGGAEAVRYSVRWGRERVTKALLLAPTAPYLVATPDNPHGIERRLMETTIAAWRTDFPRWVRENARPFFHESTSAAMVDWAVAMMSRLSVAVQLATMRGAMETDLRSDLRELSVPTLLLHGGRDVSIPIGFGRLTAELIPDCQFVEVEEAAHGLFLTHPDEVFARMLAFLR